MYQTSSFWSSLVLIPILAFPIESLLGISQAFRILLCNNLVWIYGFSLVSWISPQVLPFWFCTFVANGELFRYSKFAGILCFIQIVFQRLNGPAFSQSQTLEVDLGFPDSAHSLGLKVRGHLLTSRACPEHKMAMDRLLLHSINERVIIRDYVIKLSVDKS